MPRPSSDPNSKWVSLQKAAKLVGVTPVTIHKWKNKYDDFPDKHPETERYNMDQIRAFMDDHPDLGQPGQRVGGKREDLMCENLAKRNKLLDKQLEEADHRLVDSDKMLEVFTRERTIAREAFQKRVLDEIPAEAEGEKASVIATLLKDAFNGFMEDVQNSIPRIIRPIL